MKSKTKYTPEYLSNALSKPCESPVNISLFDGFFYGYWDSVDKVIVLSTKCICAN